MGMFDKLKDLKKLKDLDSELSKEIFEAEKEGIKATINGRSEIISICLNPDLPKERQEIILKDVLNEAGNKSKMAMAQKAAQITGFGL